MDPIATAAASGMRARLDSLDLLSNNIANASTAGYKVDREFYSVIATPKRRMVFYLRSSRNLGLTFPKALFR